VATFINHIAEGFGLSTAPFVALCVALIFLTGGLLFISAVFTSRIMKSSHHRGAQLLRSQYQKILNKIVVNETFSETGAPDAAFEYYMAELRLIAGASNFSRQLLLTQILEIKKSLTGRSAKALVKTYYAMLLHRESLRKLNAFRWQKKALAIRELAEMRYHKSVPLIERFLNSDNRTLQEECLMALVQLEDKPLAFLNHYKGDLSLWMRMNIYRYLRNIDHRNLPLFSQYFNHPKLSVRLFCVSMTRRFKQVSSVPGLVDMLYSENAKIVGVAVSALGEMEAFEYRAEIAKLSMHVWRFHTLAERVVRCLGSIGEKETDVDLIGRFLEHPCYAVRFEAVSSLKKLGTPGEEFLQRFNVNNDNKIDSMLRHFSEELLNNC
jgi:hypothetical protein